MTKRVKRVDLFLPVPVGENGPPGVLVSPAGGGPIQIMKLKKFACKSLAGKGAQSGLRIIYTFDPAAGKVDLIEIYYKGDKENEDRDRIKAYLRDF